jgi:hypothetical protein
VACRRASLRDRAVGCAEAPLRGSSPPGFHPWRQDCRTDAQPVSRSACGVVAAESESAGRVCRDGLKVGGAIAAVLFGAKRIPDRTWKTHDLRNRTIRLVQSGLALMRGGYRDLLRHSRRKK